MRASGADSIGQLTDPEHPSIDAALDIVSAGIEQFHGQLTFRIDTRGEIPTSLPDPEDVMAFLWLIDADEDPGTGQPHGALGSEFNVRAVIGESYGGGFVDVTGDLPGGGVGSVNVEGNAITITIYLSQISGAVDFNWCCASFGEIGGGYVPGNPETVIVHSDTLPFTPAARVTVTTPILELCPTGTTTGQLDVLIRDGTGNVMPNEDYTITFHSTNDAVATVDATGLVTAIAPPVYHWQTPYIEVWADGLRADNAAVIRVTHAELGVVHQNYPGERVTFYLPAFIEGVDLDGLTRTYEVVEATDRAYLAQAEGLGTVPTGGGMEYFVLDVADDPATAVCGASGNPIRLGWLWGQAANNSCYIVNDPANRVPQWFVIFHEMGHNFTAACNAFNMFLWGPSEPHNVAYAEGLGSLAAMWSWKVIVTYPTNLGPLTLANIEEHYQSNAARFRQSLDAYEDAGADYMTIDPDIVDGILLEMYDEYGLKIWFDLFSTFLPSEAPLPIPMDSTEKQATWIVAAMSASSGLDQRNRFRDEYGFPIDDAAWAEILDIVQQRIAARTWQPPGAIDESAESIRGWNRLLPAAPNPFRPPADLRFVLARGGTVKLTVYDAGGKRVATPFVGDLMPGQHTLRWDGRDDAGRRVAAGTYVARLATATGTDEQKLTVIR
jgi:hypothetical protein